MARGRGLSGRRLALGRRPGRSSRPGVVPARVLRRRLALGRGRRRGWRGGVLHPCVALVRRAVSGAGDGGEGEAGRLCPSRTGSSISAKKRGNRTSRGLAALASWPPRCVAEVEGPGLAVALPEAAAAVVGACLTACSPDAESSAGPEPKARSTEKLMYSDTYTTKLRTLTPSPCHHPDSGIFNLHVNYFNLGIFTYFFNFTPFVFFQ